MPKKKRKISKERLLKKLKNKAHKLWRECILRQFDGKCIVCLATEMASCHHIVSEHMFGCMRYDPDNGVILCPSHHKFNKLSAHKNALWFIEVALPKVILQSEIDALLVKMMNSCNEAKFIWTEEEYLKVITILEDRLYYLKNHGQSK